MSKQPERVLSLKSTSAILDDLENTLEPPKINDLPRLKSAALSEGPDSIEKNQQYYNTLSERINSLHKELKIFKNTDKTILESRKVTLNDFIQERADYIETIRNESRFNRIFNQYLEDLAKIPELKNILLGEKIKSYREKIDKKNDSKLSYADEELKHKLRVDIYKNEVKKIQEQNQTPSPNEQDHDIAVIAYYQSLDELKEFYRSRIANPNLIKNDQHSNNLVSLDAIWDPEKKLKEYQIKFENLNRIILKHRANEIINHDETDRRGGALQAEARAGLAKAKADKFIQEETRAKKIANAEKVDTQYKETIKIWNNNFFNSLKDLGPKQKQAKFLANFLENSADMYIRNYNSVAEQKEDIQKQFEVLLEVPEGDQDLSDVANRIKANLQSYTDKMTKDLGGKLKMHGAGDHFRENILNDSLYTITAKLLNKVADKSIGKSKEEKNSLVQSNETKIKEALKYLLGGSLSIIYQKIKDKYNKSQAISAAKKLGITDAHEILHQTIPQVIRNRGQYSSIDTNSK